jgi:hypothetical protein
MKCPKCNLSLTRDTLTGGKCSCEWSYENLYYEIAKAWQSRAEKAEANLQKIDATLKMEFLSSDNLRIEIKDLKKDLATVESELYRVRGITKEQIMKILYDNYNAGMVGKVGDGRPTTAFTLSADAIHALIMGEKEAKA